MATGIMAALVFSVYAVLISSARTTDAKILPDKNLNSFDERKVADNQPQLQTQSAAQNQIDANQKTVMSFDPALTFWPPMALYRPMGMGIMPPDLMYGYRQVPNFGRYNQVPNFGFVDAPLETQRVASPFAEGFWRGAPAQQLGIQGGSVAKSHYPWHIPHGRIYNGEIQQQLGVQGARPAPSQLYYGEGQALFTPGIIDLNDPYWRTYYAIANQMMSRIQSNGEGAQIPFLRQVPNFGSIVENTPLGVQSVRPAYPAPLYFGPNGPWF